MEKRLYTGRELVESGCFTADELLAGIRKGKLNPFCKMSNKKIVDVDTLPKRKLSLEEIENEERDVVCLRLRSEKEIKGTALKLFQNQEERPIVPPDIQPYLFTHYTVLEFSFSSTDVKSYSQELQASLSNLGIVEAVMQDHKTPEDDNPSNVADYIKQRFAEGTATEIIASELYDKTGNFKLIFPRKSGHPPKLHMLSVETRLESNNSMPSVF
jgi:hypothetical protein